MERDEKRWKDESNRSIDLFMPQIIHICCHRLLELAGRKNDEEDEEEEDGWKVVLMTMLTKKATGWRDVDGRMKNKERNRRMSGRMSERKNSRLIKERMDDNKMIERKDYGGVMRGMVEDGGDDDDVMRVSRGFGVFFVSASLFSNINDKNEDKTNSIVNIQNEFS